MTGPQRAFVGYLILAALVFGALAYLASTAEPEHVRGEPGLISPL